MLRLDPSELGQSTTEFSLQIEIDDQPLPGARESTLALTIAVTIAEVRWGGFVARAPGQFQADTAACGTGTRGRVCGATLH